MHSSRPDRTQLKQIADRGSRDWDTIAAILDAGFLANVAFVQDGQPFVIPMIYGRDGHALLLHGAIGSRLMGSLGSGMQVCVSVTLVDGIVLAKSAFHHSMNYRSVVVFGKGEAITEPRAKIAALRRISDHLLKDRWEQVRGPNKSELTGTAVVRFKIEDASAKVREGPPNDDIADISKPAWTGVVPLALRVGTPIADANARDASLPSIESRFA